MPQKRMIYWIGKYLFGTIGIIAGVSMVILNLYVGGNDLWSMLGAFIVPLISILVLRDTYADWKMQISKNGISKPIPFQQFQIPWEQVVRICLGDFGISFWSQERIVDVYFMGYKKGGDWKTRIKSFMPEKESTRCFCENIEDIGIENVRLATSILGKRTFVVQTHDRCLSVDYKNRVNKPDILSIDGIKYEPAKCSANETVFEFRILDCSSKMEIKKWPWKSVRSLMFFIDGCLVCGKRGRNITFGYPNK